MTYRPVSKRMNARPRAAEEDKVRVGATEFGEEKDQDPGVDVKMADRRRGRGKGKKGNGGEREVKTADALARSPRQADGKGY